MKNFVDESDLLPVLSQVPSVTVTTDYGRFDSMTPFAAKPLLKRLHEAGKIRLEKGPLCSTFQVSRV